MDIGGSSLQDKSTIVRSLRLPAPLRAFSRFLSNVHPEWAAAWAERLFLMVPRFRTPGREAAWIETAEPVSIKGRAFDGLDSLSGREEAIRGWSWGRGPVVLLVHGWAGRGSQMGAIGVELAAAGFRAVALDAPGHGESGGIRSSLPEMADAVLAAERALGPCAGYVAHSAGAAAALLAVRGGLEDIPGVLLAAPADMATFLPQFAAAIGVSDEVAQLMRQRIETRFRIRWSDLRPTELARWAGEAPLLVLSDVGDQEVPYTDGERIAGSRISARFERTIGLGHRRILRDTGVVTRAVRFLAESTRETNSPPRAVAS